MKDMKLQDIGPLQLLAVTFKHADFSGDIERELNELRSNKLVRIVDGIVVQKDTKGSMTVREESDLTPEENRAYGEVIGELIGIGTGDVAVADRLGKEVADNFSARYEYGLDKEDVELLADAIEAGDAALILLIEHVWAKPLRNAVRKSGGILLSQDFLSPELLLSIGEHASANTAT